MWQRLCGSAPQHKCGLPPGAKSNSLTIKLMCWPDARNITSSLFCHTEHFSLCSVVHQSSLHTNSRSPARDILRVLMCLINSTHTEKFSELFSHCFFQREKKKILSTIRALGLCHICTRFHPARLSLPQPAVYQECGGKTNIWKCCWNTSPFLIRAVVI